ncbi:sporulation delaying protein family toxin [Bacillus thuringiensis]|uniref:sporulation delaying protein family toxin n=1 Tax=Bacillus thuringiensis TaxID=1428 RepID=UPI000BFD42C5|nr:sporulation delaying protein family toxin [Bacillus thuringiensis]MED1904146.1 sporulation delaying protein family toxin [Bacillus thuringiensis]PGS79335.1 hypothetical protein COD02_28445 [Bacillus thuringiensis]
MKKIVASLMSFALLMGVMFQGSMQAKAAVTEASVKVFSGEELFKGLFFGQGKVAEKLPDFYSKELRKATNTPEMEKQANDLVGKVKEKDAAYLVELEAAVYSNNPQKIEKALNKGGEILTDITKDMGVSSDSLEAAEDGTGTGRCAVLGLVAIYYAAVVAQVAAGAVYVAGAAVYLATAAVNTWGRSMNGDNLSNDQLVHDIVVNL